MKTLKKALLLAVSLVMLVSTMSFTAFAADFSKQSIDLSKAKVSTQTETYDGTKKTAKVTSVVLDGKTLKEGTDYTVAVLKKKDSGTYTVTIKGIGNYAGQTATGTWTIKAATKKLKAAPKANKVSVKNSVKAKKKTTFKVKVKLAKTKATAADIKVTYKLVKYPKGTKKAQKKLVTVDKKTGKVTVKKGAKKGTYTIKVTIPKYNNFKKSKKTITFTVK